jgi:hypothetical protein
MHIVRHGQIMYYSNFGRYLHKSDVCSASYHFMLNWAQGSLTEQNQRDPEDSRRMESPK